MQPIECTNPLLAHIKALHQLWEGATTTGYGTWLLWKATKRKWHQKVIAVYYWTLLLGFHQMHPIECINPLPEYINAVHQ